MKPFVLLLCALATAASVNAASSFDDFEAGPVIAKGTGFEVRRGQLDDAFIAYRANLAARGQSIPEARRETAEAQLLDRIVVTQILIQQANADDRARAVTNAAKFLEQSRTNAESDEAFVRHLKSLGMTVAQFTNRVMEQALSEEVVSRTIRSTIVIPEADIKRVYDTNMEAFVIPELARASHILISVRDPRSGLPPTVEQKQARKEIAQKILERARKGEDFGKLAQELSDDPAAKENKGEYRFTHAKDDPRRAMVPEFEKVAFGLRPGEISDIVTTDYGYHIIKLHEIIPKRQVPFLEVHDRIRDTLVQTELEKRMTPYFAKLKETAKVEILDERLKAGIEKLAEASKSNAR